MSNKPANFFAVCWEEFTKRRAAKREAKEKAAIARAFNNRYTYLNRYEEKNQGCIPGTAIGKEPRRDFAWMCPGCNKIHFALTISVWDGVNYPGCCNFPQGNRHHMGIKGGI